MFRENSFPLTQYPQGKELIVKQIHIITNSQASQRLQTNCFFWFHSMRPLNEWLSLILPPTEGSATHFITWLIVKTFS